MGEGFPGGIGDSEGVGRGAFGCEVDAAGMGRPDFGYGRIKRHGFCVSDVVTELRGVPGVDGRRRQVKGANGEIRASQLIDCLDVVFMAFFGLLGSGAFFKQEERFVAGKEDIADV